jgi:trehalose 6-phosphate phosphatase
MKVEHLLAAWPKIWDLIQGAHHILFLSDFDGTLAPIVERPEQALLAEPTRDMLRTLTSQRRFTVGIVSGRALTDLKAKVNLQGIIYAGNHGFEIEGPGLSFINPIVREIKPFFRILRQILVLTLGTIKGVLVEDKGMTISVHYRQVEEENIKDVETLVTRAVNGPASHGLFKVTAGNKVYEVRPAVDWEKGKAIQLLMKRYGKGGRNSGLLPIYLGDDQTDEDAFRTIERYGPGLSVRIGSPSPTSAARYFLNSPAEVNCFLRQLVDHSVRGLLCEPCMTTS